MKRILFVDDEPNILDGIRRMMRGERERWDMEFAASGPAALLECARMPFDVVVSDLRMPGMDGAELLGIIRDRFPATARIILSGYSDADLALRAIPVAYRIIAKPCNALDLKQTIDRVCTLQDVFCTPGLRRVIGTIGELPSLSSTYLALGNAMRDPNSSIGSITTIIERDVAISAKILQVVNGGFFGLARRSTSLRQAVTYLGTDTIRTLALYSETFRTFAHDKRLPRTFLADMQRHSHQTAIIAATLPLERHSRDMTLTAVLLHDVGKLALSTSMTDQFCTILKKMRIENMPQWQAEEEVLGISHAEIGAYLLGLWGIGNMAVEAIAHHHRPTRITHSGLDCSVAVYLANLLANEIAAHPEDTSGEQLSEHDREALRILRLTENYPIFRQRAASALLQETETTAH